MSSDLDLGGEISTPEEESDIPVEKDRLRSPSPIPTITLDSDSESDDEEDPERSPQIPEIKDEPQDQLYEPFDGVEHDPIVPEDEILPESTNPYPEPDVQPSELSSEPSTSSERRQPGRASKPKKGDMNERKLAKRIEERNLQVEKNKARIQKDRLFQRMKARK